MFQSPFDRAVWFSDALSDSHTVPGEKRFHIESPVVCGRPLDMWRICGLQFVH